MMSAPHFANARTVRNALELARLRHAHRVSSDLHREWTRDDSCGWSRSTSSSPGRRLTPARASERGSVVAAERPAQFAGNASASASAMSWPRWA